MAARSSLRTWARGIKRDVTALYFAARAWVYFGAGAIPA